MIDYGWMDDMVMPSYIFDSADIYVLTIGVGNDGNLI